MDGVVKNYRRGKKHINERQLVIDVNGIDSKAGASGIVGCKARWKNSAGRFFTGKITAAHGDNGAVRAMFPKGMPGQCIGEKVEIVKPQKKAAAKPASKEAHKEKPKEEKKAKK